MLDPTLPLTVLDYEEFGDPNSPDEFEAISSYSPYDNLAPDVCYPPVLVTASFNDTRFFRSKSFFLDCMDHMYILFPRETVGSCFFTTSVHKYMTPLIFLNL
jgi:hypothetical protein